MSLVVRLFGWCGVLLLVLASIACSSKKPKSLEPLSAPAWLVQLPVPGFGPARVAVPLAATTPRPIVVVLHGAADRPEWQCGSFRGVLGGRVFIVCPQGLPRLDFPDRFGLGSLDGTAAELRAALKALKARFGGHVAQSPILLIGYAEGAALAAELARQEPEFFARVALVTGDPTAFTSSAASIFAGKGGKRALFFCTTRACQEHGAQRALWLTRRGVAAKSVLHDVGPYLNQQFNDALRGELKWLVEDDVRWPKAQQ